MRRSTLRRGSGIARRKPLAPISDKRRADLVEYREKRKHYLSAHQNCEIRFDDRCRGRSVEIHHVWQLSQGAPLVWRDDADVLASCDFCNVYLKERPAEAKARGFVRRPSDDR